MLKDCQKYSLAINAKRKPFPTEPLIRALLMAQHKQHKMMVWSSEIKESDKVCCSSGHPELPIVHVPMCRNFRVRGKNDKQHVLAAVEIESYGIPAAGGTCALMDIRQ
jgi:hypothetical protein